MAQKWGRIETRHSGFIVLSLMALCKNHIQYSKCLLVYSLRIYIFENNLSNCVQKWEIEMNSDSWQTRDLQLWWLTTTHHTKRQENRQGIHELTSLYRNSSAITAFWFIILHYHDHRSNPIPSGHVIVKYVKQWSESHNKTEDFRWEHLKRRITKDKNR